MFTQSVSSPPTAAASSPTPASSTNSSQSSRSSRLRGLSYLRNYTQSHLLSRDHSPSSSAAAVPSTSSRPVSGLARAASFSPSTTLSQRRREAESSTDSTPNPPSLLVPVPHPTPTTNHDRTSTTANPPQARLDQPDTLANATSAATTANGESSQIEEDTMARGRASTTTTTGEQGASANTDMSLPSIRLSAYYDARAPRPSLSFQPVSRTLPTGGEVIKVGRYSERDNQPHIPINAPSAAPVGFKSKVVSRRHCEFWFEDGKWYIRDVKSSSGTFLNHIRLSPPATESKPYVVNDGDIVQLGIDFKGGEEMIFRCVKMRLELNRGWQSKLNTFNMSTHKQLRSLAGPSGSSSQDCSICLNSIAPCQSLFVAPCSHTWHYKCIRSLINSPQYPIFICPNCRAAADLEAEVDDAEEWEQLNGDEVAVDDDKDIAGTGTPNGPPPNARVGELNGAADAGDTTVRVDLLTPTHTPQNNQPRVHTQSEPVPIGSSSGSAYLSRNHRTPSPENGLVTNGHEGPITPRNDAGPWVFDGSAGEDSSPTGSNAGGMRSLDSAALEAERRP